MLKANRKQRRSGNGPFIIDELILYLEPTLAVLQNTNHEQRIFEFQFFTSDYYKQM